MRLAVLAVGSRGDVQPYVALAEGLARAGHAVRVGTHAPFADLVRARGLEFAELGANPRELLETEAAAAWIASRNPVAFFRNLGDLARPLALALADDILRACDGADGIVTSSLAGAGIHVAEARGVPHVAAALQPLSPTAAFPSVLVPGLDWLGPRGRRATHRAAAIAFDLPFRGAVNAWRRDALGLAPLRDLDFYGRLDREHRPVLYGFSPVVVPKPADWGEWLHVCGYWSLQAGAGWRPPPALAAFLAAGPPPVYVGFGSMRVADPERTSAVLADGLARAGVRGLIGAGWAGLASAPGHRSGDLFTVGDVPHDWLFPRCAAVVTHGGAGTTATALRAGVPSFAVPFFADQFFWGARTARLGVGPAPVPLRRLEAGRFAAGVRAAVGTSAMRARAAAVGRALAREDGVGVAVVQVERAMGGREVPRRE